MPDRPAAAFISQPGVAYCVAGKFNSADKLYLVIDSVRLDTKHARYYTALAILVEKEPSAWQLDRTGVPAGSTLLGLYEGNPLKYRSVFQPFGMPDRITIFQLPHERIVRHK